MLATIDALACANVLPAAEALDCDEVLVCVARGCVDVLATVAVLDRDEGLASVEALGCAEALDCDEALVSVCVNLAAVRCFESMFCTEESRLVASLTWTFDAWVGRPFPSTCLPGALALDSMGLVALRLPTFVFDGLEDVATFAEPRTPCRRETVSRFGEVDLLDRPNESASAASGLDLTAPTSCRSLPLRE